MDRVTRFLIIASLAVGTGMHLCAIFRTRDMLTDRPFRDDSFYALTVSRSLAKGRGLSVSDGEIPTNGIQPLFVFVCALPYLVTGDPWTALRLVQVLHFVVHAASILLMFMLIRVTGGGGRAAWTGAALWASSYGVLTQMSNGLETGLYLLVLQVIAWFYAARAGLEPLRIRDSLGMGFLLGVATLARIDAGLLCGAMGAHFAIVHRGRGFMKNMLRGPVLWFSAWLPVTLPWWLYNTSLTGSPLPVSGLVQTHFVPDSTLSIPMEILENIWYAAQVLLDHALLVVFTPLRLIDGLTPASIAVFLIKAAMAAGLLVLLRRAWTAERLPESLSWRRTGYFPVFVAALTAFYVFVFNAEWYMNRYLIPFALASAVVIPMSLERLRPAAGQILMGSSILFTLAFGGYAYTRNADTTFEDHCGWVFSNVPESTWVAASQSGTLGYFHERTINTDGKVNTEMYGMRLGSFGNYLASRDVEYFIEWDGDLMFFDSSFNALYEQVDICGRSRVFRRIQGL